MTVARSLLKLVYFLYLSVLLNVRLGNLAVVCAMCVVGSGITVDPNLQQRVTVSLRKRVIACRAGDVTCCLLCVVFVC